MCHPDKTSISDKSALSSCCGVCNNPTEPSSIPGYRRCGACQLLQAERKPPDRELAHYYSDDYEVDRSNYLRSVARRGQREMEWLESLSPPGRMLEVGCSWGKFLDVARNRGWDVSGVELSRPASEWARAELKLNVFTGRLEDSSFCGSQAFDLVAAWHVVEHVPEPLEFLRACHSCLRPGGHLVLKTPNIDSFSARVNGPAWPWVDPVSHLVLFSPAALAGALGRTGFEVSHLFTRRGDAKNPWLEIARATAKRIGIHRQKNPSFEASPGSDNSSQSSQRKLSLLNSLNRAFDVGLFFLLPVEEILNWADMGPELRIVAAAT